MPAVTPLDGPVLTVVEMRAADRAAIACGRPGSWLMANAGRAVANAIRARFALGSTVVLCGPGNNGGDGFVAAARLRAAGWPVRVALLGERAALKGDAAWAATLWDDPIEPLSPASLADAGLVVDALFGAGLTRPVEGAARAALETAGARGVPLVAVDVPSGLDGDSGAPLGQAQQAALTVTFGRPKPGHLLVPGRRLCGELVVADIGLPAHATRQDGPGMDVNGPRLWRHALPRRRAEAHKYDYGHAVVLGGPTKRTGAARLAATAALRAGAGLVTIACPPDALAVYAPALLAVMVEPVADEAAFADFLAGRRRNAALLGPGAGVGPATRAQVLRALSLAKACVLDADALTSFADAPETLFAAVEAACVLTPHEGEFARLFTLEGSKLERARKAAAISRAVVVLKGPDTVVAAPDGRAAIQAQAPPWLATAGTGDVLAGIVLGLLAQGMPAFEAAAAAAWLHAATAARLGPGMIADDMLPELPAALATFG
jgi:NAD(P)H-hydrate epimerase